MRKTKIVCTLGPSSSSPEVMKQLLEAGLNVARFNFSHGTHEGHAEMIARFRSVRDEMKKSAAVLLDTKGPEIRLGDFNEPTEIVAEQEFTLTTEECIGDAQHCYINYKGLPHDVNVGTTILVDDGNMSMEVLSTTKTEIHCRVIDGGTLKNHKGVNVPGVKLEMPFLSERDKSDLLFGIEQDVDYVAASFTRRPEDVIELRKFLKDNGGESIRIICKIENTEGVEKYDQILELADGIMVARGDLGVEVPYELLPGLQKSFISKCVSKGKIVITATQMLDSMEENRRPTRAEISDVANAVFDGTSAVMLSGETASGMYPVEAVKTMARIAERAENDAFRAGVYDNLRKKREQDGEHDKTNAVSAAACTLADQMDATAIIADTHTGRAATRVSRYRPTQPILACTPNKKAFHQMALIWDAFPIMIRPADTVDVLFHIAIEKALDLGYLNIGDTVVLTAGIPLNTSGSTNMLKVQVVD